MDLFSSTSSRRRAKNSGRDRVKVTQVKIWGLLMRGGRTGEACRVAEGSDRATDLSHLSHWQGWKK